MSTLRERLKTPQFWLVALAGFYIAVVVDVCREPDNQYLARGYVACVHMYQVIGRPLIKDRIHCRYEPTCSEYSIVAVKRYGLIEGLILTKRRIESCTKAVRAGTIDPVPELICRDDNNFDKGSVKQLATMDEMSRVEVVK